MFFLRSLSLIVRYFIHFIDNLLLDEIDIFYWFGTYKPKVVAWMVMIQDSRIFADDEKCVITIGWG